MFQRFHIQRGVWVCIKLESNWCYLTPNQIGLRIEWTFPYTFLLLAIQPISKDPMDHSRFESMLDHIIAYRQGGFNMKSGEFQFY